MTSRAVAYGLKLAQRNLLVEHVCGACPIIKDGRMMSFNSLMNKGLIRGSTVNGASHLRPTHSMLTDLGREVVAVLLAEAAEALVKAGCFEAPVPSEFDIYQRLKRKKPKSTAPVVAINE